MNRTLARAGALALAVCLAAAPALAQSPPQIRWTGGQIWTPDPVSLIGFDSLSGQPCIVGQTTTCVLPVSGGGGGGGGAVTVAAGADVTEGTTADAAYTGSGNGTVDALLKGLYAAATTTPLPAGSKDTTIGATGGVLRTAGGWTPKLLNGLTTTIVQLKATAGQLGMLQCYNPNSAQIYVQVLDSASPTLGTTAPVLSIPIAPGATGGVALSLVGAQFNNAIEVAATTTATGSTAPTTAIDCNALFN